MSIQYMYQASDYFIEEIILANIKGNNELILKTVDRLNKITKKIVDDVRLSECLKTPYYYKHELITKTIYGKIDFNKNKYCTVTLDTMCNSIFIFEINDYHHGDDSYFTDEHRSTKEEYESAVKRALKFVENFDKEKENAN